MAPTLCSSNMKGGLCSVWSALIWRSGFLPRQPCKPHHSSFRLMHRASESLMHMAAEMDAWLETFVTNKQSAPASKADAEEPAAAAKL